MFPHVLQSLVFLTSLCFCIHAEETDDAKRNTSAIIQSRGFLPEQHDILTNDGYVISMFRIVHPNSPGVEMKGKPILLMHPLLGESANWIINSAAGFVNESTDEVGNNLGFELAKRGYDVWLGNVRGNVNALKHKSLTTSDSRFWEFSFDEHSSIDLPAQVEFILNETGYSKVDYVGHSQGTMIMFALLSSNPEYSGMVDRFIALGPVAFMGHITSPLKYFMTSIPFKFYLSWFPGSFLPPDSILLPISRIICPGSVTGKVCTNFLFLVCGYDGDQIEKERLPVIVAHAPAGTSKANMLHYLQGMDSKRFRMFDHGRSQNLARYGTSEPPDYDLSRINHSKISLIWGENDALADPTDVQILREHLTVKLADDFKVPIKEWNHLDYLWARDAGKYVNTKVLEILSRSDE